MRESFILIPRMKLVESSILYEVVFGFLNFCSAKNIFQACLVAQIEDLGHTGLPEGGDLRVRFCL